MVMSFNKGASILENNQTIRSVQRSIDILQCLKENNEELTMTEISEITSLSKSTVSRLLYTLEINSFVEKDPNSGKYRLGRELYFLGNIAGRSIQLKEEAKDIMERLRDQLRETINLYVLDGKY